MIERKLLSAFLLLFFVLGQARYVGAQEYAFAYVKKENGRKPSGNVASGKYAIAKQVYDILVTARGELRMPTPEFKMTNGEQFVAWMDPENTVIGLEEKAFDACMMMGADSLNALAALLSHELTHYYEKHDWRRHFVQQNMALELSEKISTQDEGLEQETQADNLGGFLALGAGYNVYDISARLLPLIYKSYTLADSLGGYPSLAQRVAISHTAAEHLKGLQAVYETAQYLSLLEDFETAAAYYRFVLQDYPGREIINNAGVNEALEALQLFSAKEMPYVLPLEPDPNSRLYSLKGLEQDRIQKRTRLLKAAIQDFDKAIQLDPDYAPAFLNKACCFALLNAFEDASYWLSKYSALAGANAGSALVLKGIIAALQQDTEKAKSVLEEARQQGNGLAEFNLRVINQEASVPPEKKGSAELEKINDIYLDDYLETLELDKQVKPTATTNCGVKEFKKSKMLVHCTDDISPKYTVIQVCGKGCDSSTQKGIKVGSRAEAVEQTYGKPIHQVAWKGGYAWTYPHLNLLFEFDNAGNLTVWGCYRQSID
jgi:tetratricopeptide (TPR) repeat protein